ncbi:hypothetical protein CR513_36514, partial [Mucuna pruriens]
MVISVVAAEYKVETVLIDQGSSANILYWSSFQKIGLCRLTESPGALYVFAGECVLIKRTVELETGVRAISVLYTVVDVEASYNIIIGRPALNRLGVVVSIYYLCMKFPVGREVGSVWANSRVACRCYKDSLRVRMSTMEPTVNVLDLDLNPRCLYENGRPHSAEDVKEVQIGSLAIHVTQVGMTLGLEEEVRLVDFLRRDIDVFTWTPKDMPGIDPNFMSHHLSVIQGAKPIGEEKRKAVKEETNKLLTIGFIREVQYPTWLANVVMVKKSNGWWRMCTDYTDLNKACPKDPYPLPSIDRLVDGVSGYTLLNFMDAYSDEEKTAFITEVGAFCYKVMPFSLKNTGATY